MRSVIWWIVKKVFWTISQENCFDWNFSWNNYWVPAYFIRYKWIEHAINSLFRAWACDHQSFLFESRFLCRGHCLILNYLGKWDATIDLQCEMRFSKRSWCAISFWPMKFLVEVSTLWKVAVSNFAMEPVYIILLNLLTPSSTAQLGAFNTLWTHIFFIRCIFRPLRFAESMPGFLKMCLLSATGIFKLVLPGSITFTDRKTPPITIVILNEVIIPFSSWFYQSQFMFQREWWDIFILWSFICPSVKWPRTVVGKSFVSANATFAYIITIIHPQ